MGLTAGALLGWCARGASLRREHPLRHDVAPLAALPAASTPSDEALRAVESRLATLEQALRGLARRPAADDVGGSAALELGPRLDELLARVGALETLLAERELEGDASGPRTSEPTELAALRQENPEVRWPALLELIDLWRRDEDAAQRLVRFLTDRDLLRRYGAPSATWSNEQGLHWFYRDGHDPALDAWHTEVYFRLQGGYVTVLGVKAP